MLLYQILPFTIYEKILKSQTKTRLKISVPTWNKKCELHDGSYSVSDIQDYFEYIIKKHETVTYNPPIRTHVNNIENRITFRIKTGYNLKLLTLKTMKLLANT